MVSLRIPKIERILNDLFGWIEELQDMKNIYQCSWESHMEEINERIIRKIEINLVSREPEFKLLPQVKCNGYMVKWNHSISESNLKWATRGILYTDWLKV